MFFPQGSDTNSIIMMIKPKLEAVEKEVNRKWQINLKRKWVWNGKTYHHVGDDNV